MISSLHQIRKNMENVILGKFRFRGLVEGITQVVDL
jgi:hypothetical protein